MFIKALILGILALSFLQASENCSKRIAAFDIGSGATKLYIADVDVCLQKITKEILRKDTPVPYKDDLQRSLNRTFSRQVMDQGKSTLSRLKQEAQEIGVTNFKAVATSAFRDATNAQEFVEEIKMSLNIEIDIIDQQEEALLGFYGAVAKTSMSPREILVWDIGGGSMQITSLNENGHFEVYKGQFASVSFKNHMIADIQNLSIDKVKSPNPISLEDAHLSLLDIKNEVDLVPNGVKDQIVSGKKIIGIGGVHSQSIKARLDRVNKIYSKKNIKDLMFASLGLTDDQINSRYADTEVSNLILVYGFMNSLGIELMETHNVSLCDGLIIKH